MQGVCMKHKTYLIIAIIPFGFATKTWAQSSVELMCRQQAKEIAAETYKNCVTEKKQQQIGQIRNEYQNKLTELKNHYDQELKKLSSGETSTPKPAAGAGNPPAPRTGRASGARALPEKAQVKSESLSLNESPETSNTDVSELEIVEIPVE
jgi:hypothetical protein